MDLLIWKRSSGSASLETGPQGTATDPRRLVSRSAVREETSHALITSLAGAFTQQLAATLTRISVTPSGGQANGNSGFFNSASAQVFSGDGRRIVFETQSDHDFSRRHQWSYSKTRWRATSSPAQPRELT